MQGTGREDTQVPPTSLFTPHHKPLYCPNCDWQARPSFESNTDSWAPPALLLESRGLESQSGIFWIWEKVGSAALGDLYLLVFKCGYMSKGEGQKGS